MQSERKVLDMTKPKAYIIGPFFTSSDGFKPANDEIVIAVDQGLDRALEAGIVPDIVAGDLDSLSDSGIAWLEKHSLEVEVIKAQARKDFSDLDLALRVCAEKGLTSVDLHGFIGGRLDHQLVVIGVCTRYATDLSIEITDVDQRALFLIARQSMTVARDSLFSVIAIEGSAKVSIVGARYPLSNHLLGPLSDLGLSNVAEDDCAITVHEGTGLVWIDVH
jgi:thiamine pyrophosphokinase